ncbi:MAG: hypothetical protein FWF45_00720 [Coriobacteriia bacterium]|nr:hypothetical protein [Coriobacteriia bacterium]
MQCKYCQKETDQHVIFGIYEREHYDDRHSTADHDTGKTTFDATAVVDVPYCAACGSATQKMVMKKDLKYAGYLLIGAVAAGILAAIQVEPKHDDSKKHALYDLQQYYRR